MVPTPKLSRDGAVAEVPVVMLLGCGSCEPSDGSSNPMRSLMVVLLPNVPTAFSGTVFWFH
jgi:hypothetical protein